MLGRYQGTAGPVTASGRVAATGATTQRGAGGLLAFALGLVAFLVALLTVPATSQAASIYQYTGAFGGACGVAGQPSCPSDGLFRQDPLPQRMAVHQESGKLFVADPGSNRVQVFTPNANGGDYAYSISTPAPQAVAFDPVSSDLYVVNRAVSPNPGRVTKFNPDDPSNPTSFTEDPIFTTPVQGSGAGQVGGFSAGLAPSFPPTTLTAQTLRGGIAVDPTTQDILVVDTTRNQLHRFDSDGGYEGSITGADAAADRPAFSRLMDVGVLPDGDLVTADFRQVAGTLWRPRIDRYSPAGELQATLSSLGHNEIAMDFQTSYMALGVDQESGEVFAVSQVGNDFFLSPPGPPVEPGRVYQFENDELVNDFGISGNGLRGYKTGIAVKSNPARLYVLSTDIAGFMLPATDGLGVPRIQVFDAAIPPTAVIDPIDLGQVTARTAWISGVVNPKGQQTSWRVQFRKKGTSGWPNETAPLPVGDEDDDFNVGTTVEGLEPNTEYEARIMAENAGGLLVPSGLVEFRTKKTAPEIGLALAGFLDHDSAEIRAEINPLNAQSGFWVEYGTSDDYGSRAPLAPATADAGSGGAATIQVQPLTGLLPGTQYHYRVVAENDEGQQNASDDQTFTTLAADPGGLQGERGFELVTKQPAGDAHHPDAGELSVDGESFWYHYGATEVLMPGEDKPHKNVLARRGEDGWSYRFIDHLDPGHMHFDPAVYVSEKMDTVFLWHSERNEIVGLDPDDQNGVADLYLRRGDGDYLWISRSELQPAGGPGVDPEDSAQTDPASSGQVGTAGGTSADAISADGSTVVFMSNRRLTEADQNASAPDSDVRRRAQSRLYKWRDGKLILLSQRPDGSQPTGIGVALGSSRVQGASATMDSPHAVSHDGSRVFWTDGTNMYLQIDGKETRDLGPGEFKEAAPDGSRVYYTRGGRLYLRNVDEPTERDITGTDQVQGVVAVAESGERIYYVSKAALAAAPSPLGQRPVAGENNLYVTDLDSQGAATETRLVTRLGDSLLERSIWAFQSNSRPAGASPDGSVLTIASASSLTGQETAGVQQLYVYDHEKASFTCPSCLRGGATPEPLGVNGRVHVSGVSDGLTSRGWITRRLVATDGTVFFDTPTALLPDDKNSVRDVYEYRNGELRLLTSGGPSDGPSAVVNASADGTSVAISSQTGFTPHDIDPGFYKFWVLRVGGGFPYITPAPDCSGQGCEAELSAPPVLAAPGSAELRGRGNVKAEQPVMRRAALRVANARAGRGSVARLRVRVSGAGRIVVTGGKVRRAGRRSARAGNVAVAVRLKPAARRQLARRGRLRTSVRVVFRSADGQRASRRAVVTFRNPAQGRKRGGR